MAENLTIARPYAEAVFASALENNKIDQWHNMLNAMSCACSDETFLYSLKNASSGIVASNSLIQLLDGLIDEFAKNFIYILGENARFDVLPEIFAEFTRLKDEHNKVIHAELVSARPLDAAQLSELKTKLSTKYGKEVSLSTTIDENLIGGAILKIGDQVIDASVKTSLTNLSSTLR